MKKRVGRLPSAYQLCISALAVCIISVVQFSIINKTCLAFSVKCTVKDKDTGEPIPQAIVKLIKLKSFSTGDTTINKTGDNGKVIFANVEEGLYDVIADAQCYERRKKEAILVNGDEKIRFRLPAVGTEQGTLSGVVKDGITGLAISGASVAIWPYGPVVETDVDGSYTFDCIEIDTDKVSAFKEGYIESKKNVQIQDPPATTTLNFKLFPARIKGRVTEAAVAAARDEGDPIPDVLVEAFFDSTVSVLFDKDVVASDKTNDNGRYKLYLDPGTYRVMGSKFGFAPYTSGIITLEGEGTHEENFSLEPCNSTLKVKVKRKDNDEPIPGATARIIIPLSEPGEATTNKKGIAKFDRQCLNEGNNYTVEVEKVGFETKEKTIPSAAAGENKLVFKLTAVSTTTTTSSTTTTEGTTSSTSSTTTITSSSTTTTSSTTSTTEGTTTTTTSGTTTTTLCDGNEEDITFTNDCTTFGFAIVGESGPRTEDLSYKRDGKGRIIEVTGTVTYTDSGYIYCVEINVNWGFFCISSVNGTARLIE